MISPADNPVQDSREQVRQIVHLGAGALALLLRWLGRWEAAGLAAAALLFNCLILPRTALERRIARPGEPFFAGIRAYPASVLILVLVFPMPVAAAAWGIMAVGDAASTLAGRRWGQRKLPWNSGKSWAGSLAFVFSSAPAAFGITLWVSAGQIGGETAMPVSAMAWASLIGALAGALLESLPLPLNDNWSVPVGSGLVMWLALA